MTYNTRPGQNAYGRKLLASVLEREIEREGERQRERERDGTDVKPRWNRGGADV